ncbi:ABC transporter ATP-binding protein [Brevibacillus humidisoli]|uniref:ATP-binding cassette domain-containing protein n=1 Tax=Brevibacillus humidisoli TaxID=2895522 RepID=UPI001E5272F2|nr:ABC transporter ATP-binding protein [Brevibacillus humidisoli]UFJ39295.1 ABC transporter ATP-binding protein [Brevibacillus humidisoli]
MRTMPPSLLCVEQLEISCQEDGKWTPIVQDVSFQLYPGEMVTLTGPSGCGKSLTAHAIVGLLEAGWRVTNGRIRYQDKQILDLDSRGRQKLRREEIGLLIQDSLHGLNPIQTVKKQMVETLLQQKRKISKKERDIYLHSLLLQVGFRDPASVLASYPFELSGGMRQRVLLAMMVSLHPKILIADEPTTALDMINREKVLSLLKRLQHDLGLTVLLISHDQQSVQRFADRIIRMERGGMVR